MKVRLGYISICNTLDKSPFKKITYTKFNKTNDYKLIDNTITTNLENLIKILIYNTKNNIHIYRLESNIIPLATNNKVKFDYLDKYQIYYNKISRIINDKNITLDIHTDKYCNLTSTNQSVIKHTTTSLEYYYNLLKTMKVQNITIITHIGFSQKNKKEGILEFINNYSKLPNYIQESLAIENDDEIYNISDIIKISKILNIPIVLNYHNHICNNNGINIDNYLEEIFSSWKEKQIIINFSSPKGKKEIKQHNDYINTNEFIEFLTIIQKYNKDIDIVLDAKEKDIALFKLIRILKYKTNYKFIDETTIIL